nr:hypothetical protein [Treponema sp.]
MKKILFVFAQALLLSPIFSQEIPDASYGEVAEPVVEDDAEKKNPEPVGEETKEGPSFSVFGDLYFTGYISENHRGVSMKNGNQDDSLVGIKAKLDEYTGAVARFKFTAAANADSDDKTVDFKDAYVYSDVLGECGIDVASLVLKAGYKSWNSDYFCPSAMTIDDTYVQNDKTKDRLSFRVDAGYNDEKWPVTLSFASDLDFGSALNDSDNNNAGQTFFAQVSEKKQPVLGYVDIDWNFYFCRYFNELNSDSTAVDYDHFIQHMGATMGVDVLVIPNLLGRKVSVRPGFAWEYTRTVSENDNESTSWDFQVGLKASVEKIASLSLMYFRDGENPVYDKGDYNPARYFAFQTSFDMVEKFSAYYGMAYQFNETVVNAAPSSAADRTSFEFGASFVPLQKVCFTLGWQRGEWGINAPVTNLKDETGALSKGQIFLQTRFSF